MEREAFEQFVALEREHWWFRARRRVYLGLLRRSLAGRPLSRALDVGAGVGGFLEGLAVHAERVVGLEAHPRGVRLASQRGRFDLARAEANALPFQDGSFELACLFDVLEHLDDDQGALAECARVLAPGGLCLVSVPAWPVLFANNDRIAGHRRRYRRRELVRRFESAGLCVLRASYTNALLFPAIALTVGALKLWECSPFSPRDARHTNLSWIPPAPLDALFYGCFAIERPLVERFDLPWGHSLLVLGEKR